MHKQLYYEITVDQLFVMRPCVEFNVPFKSFLQKSASVLSDMTGLCKTETSEQADLTDKKLLFLAKILESEKKKHTHYNVLLRDEYTELVAQVEAGSSSKTKSQTIQRRVNRFRLLNIEGEKILVTKTDGNIKYFLPAERLFDEIHKTHLLIKHGGRDKMLRETSAIYANVTKEMINTYLLMCEVCLQKNRKQKQCQRLFLQHH